nr:MAG TPA: hypothetical protein [Caudoviricetes sp.]
MTAFITINIIFNHFFSSLPFTAKQNYLFCLKL